MMSLFGEVALTLMDVSARPWHHLAIGNLGYQYRIHVSRRRLIDGLRRFTAKRIDYGFLSGALGWQRPIVCFLVCGVKYDRLTD